MACKVGGVVRRAAAGEIGGACHDDAAHAADPPRDECRVGEGADAHADVEVLLDEIDVAIVEKELRIDARMRVEEACQHRCHVPPAEYEGRRHPHEPAQGAGTGRRPHRFVVVGEDAARFLGEAPAFERRRQPPRRALDEADADPLLQGRERARHRRRRAPQPARCAGEAAGLDDRREHCQLVETVHGNPSVLRKSAFPFAAILLEFSKA